MPKKITLLLMVLAFVFSSCQSAKNDSFAIYLLTKNIPAAELVGVDINQWEIEKEPILSINDIVSYAKSEHTLQLTQAAYTRVQNIFPTPVRVGGIPFMVCAGGERIYTGAFWTPLSSLSYDGVVILQSFDPTGTTIQIALGYPGSDFFAGNDPRDDPRILQALEQENKLK